MATRGKGVRGGGQEQVLGRRNVQRMSRDSMEGDEATSPLKATSTQLQQQHLEAQRQLKRPLPNSNRQLQYLESQRQSKQPPVRNQNQLLAQIIEPQRQTVQPQVEGQNQSQILSQSPRQQVRNRLHQLNRETQVEHQSGGSISQPSSADSCSLKKKLVRGKYNCTKLDLKTTSVGVKQLEVKIPDDILRPVGENARDLVNFCGLTVRSFATLAVDTWQDVVGVLGDAMLKHVKERFKPDIRNELRFDALVLSTMQRQYRTWKNWLHMIYKQFKTDMERMENVPDDITPEDWKKLITHFSSEDFQKVSNRNAINRTKLKTKHTCGTKSYAEIEELTKDPITGEKAPPDEVWLKQHTKKAQDGELLWSDPKFKGIHEQLQELVIQQTQDDGSQMTRDEMLLHVLGEKSGYFRGKGAGKKPPSKRLRQEDVQEQIQRAVDQAKEAMMGEVTENMLERVRQEVRAEVRAEQRFETRAEIRAEEQEALRMEIRSQMQAEFDAMFQERMAAFFGSMSQSKG